MNSPIVHISSEHGHRASYRDLFAELLGAKHTTGQIRGALLWKLFRAPLVIFATLDDDYFGFIAVSIIRSLLRRPTTALFLRPLQCFRTERSIVYPLKRFVFRALLHLPKLSILSIIPHEIRPELRKVSHDWIHDPQMWDLWVSGCPNLPETELSRRVEAMRAGRSVMIYIGGANRMKGFDSFARHISDEKIFLVAAGCVAQECLTEAEKLIDQGMIVEDRYVTDTEILSLYHVADMAWCCYAPNYDQASGVFGRALQTGVIPIVREGSVIADLAKMLKVGKYTPSSSNNAPISYIKNYPQVVAGKLLQSPQK